MKFVRPGLTILITGLPCAGKTTVAKALLDELTRRDRRAVTILDGDAVRRDFYPDLGFSKGDRDTNVRRVGALALEFSRTGGIAICSLVAPYDATRKEVRATVEAESNLVLIYLSTPLSTCEQRDTRGLYAKARAGVIPDFTGISAPYEVPLDADLSLDASILSPHQATNSIICFLLDRDLISGEKGPLSLTLGAEGGG